MYFIATEQFKRRVDLMLNVFTIHTHTTRQLLEVTDIFIILIEMTVSWVYA